MRRSQACPHRAKESDHQTREARNLTLKCPDFGTPKWHQGPVRCVCLAPCAYSSPWSGCACTPSKCVAVFLQYFPPSQPFFPGSLLPTGIFVLSTGSSQIWERPFTPGLIAPAGCPGRAKVILSKSQCRAFRVTLAAYTGHTPSFCQLKANYGHSLLSALSHLQELSLVSLEETRSLKCVYFLVSLVVSLRWQFFLILLRGIFLLFAELSRPLGHTTCCSPASAICGTLWLHHVSLSIVKTTLHEPTICVSPGILPKACFSILC